MTSVAPVGAKTGTMSPDDFGDACRELAQENEANRAEVVGQLEAKKSLKGLNEDEEKVLSKAKTVGMTFSSAVCKLPGVDGAFSGCSNGTARDQIPGRMVDGGSGAQKNGLSKAIRMSHDDAHEDAKQAAGVLCDNSHVHWGGGYGAHAEPKIVNHVTNQVGAEKMRGGSMLFNIDWRSSRYGPSGMPCGGCYAMLCHAAKACDIQIFVCDQDQKPTELSEDDCNSEDGYDQLCTRVDGGPGPGRKPKK